MVLHHNHLSKTDPNTSLVERVRAFTTGRATRQFRGSTWTTRATGDNDTDDELRHHPTVEEGLSLTDISVSAKSNSNSNSHPNKTPNSFWQKFNNSSWSFPVIVYFALSPIVYYSASIAIYPGSYLDVVSTGCTSSVCGVEFPFPVSSYDGRTMTMQGYKKMFGNIEDTTHYNDTIPVVMYGGNGQSMYSYLDACETYLHRAIILDPNLQFTCYTFSYRGYAPNTGGDLGKCSENKNTQDADDFFEFVRGSHGSGDKILVFSHSLGTGVATKVAAKKDDELACLILGMPFASMLQTTFEVSYYGSLYWFWLIDSWRSYSWVDELDADLPLLILSADEDELIPPHHQFEMLEKANTVDKTLIRADTNHNGIYSVIDANVEEYDSFFGRCLA